MRLFLGMLLAGLLTSALAHDGMHDSWLKELTNQAGGQCCDGSDALRLDDVSWRRLPDGAFEVDIQGQHVRVQPDRVVKGSNKVGYALAWPYTEGDGKWNVRCFMPGTEI